jgi:hypothetical protein
MNQYLKNRDQEGQRALTKALEQRLGFYNSEEEADRLALEWLSLLGVGPEAALHQWLRFAKLMDPYQQDGDSQFNSDRCAQLFQAVPRWTERGRELPVPYGSFTGLHASPCFRLWNLDQRLRYGPVMNIHEFVDPAADLASYQDLREQVLNSQAPQVHSFTHSRRREGVMAQF